MRGLTARGCWRSGRQARWLAVAVLLIFTLGGCESLLDVSLPGQTPADVLDDPAYAPLMVHSAQGDFECAFSNYVHASGHIAGELVGGNTALVQLPYHSRDVRPVHQAYGEDSCAGNVGLYTPLSGARFVAEDAYKRIGAFSDAQVPGRAGLLGRAALYAGFSYTVFAEGFCRAAFDLGPALTPTEVFSLAKSYFTLAIDHAADAGDPETMNAAYVGRARVHLALGETSEAAADARLVPTGFVYVVTRSNADARRQNDIFESINRTRSQSIDPNYWDVTWQGVPDPRVSVTNTGTRATDGLTPLWFQTKYPATTTPIRLASYVEAQLIIAEVDGGQVAVDIINVLHDAAGIPGFASSDPEEIRQQLIEERRREFFLEGRRMGDLRRLGGFAEAASAGQPNPWTSVVYGGTECFPLPDVEIRNNPNLSP